MHVKYLLIGMAILAMLVFYTLVAHAQTPTISSGNLGQAINSTASFINKVNQSGYLLFYPNLTQAYHYLDIAKTQPANSTAYAYSLLAQARSSAQSQLNAMNAYKTYSLYATVASAVVLAVLLYALMAPRGSAVGRKRRTEHS